MTARFDPLLRLRAHISTAVPSKKPAKVLITSPIFYPHIGHLYSATLADTLKRWHEFRGNRVIFSTGTDEHGLKIQEAAKSKGVEPRAFCDQISSKFKTLFELGNISYTDFIRTTEPRHVRAVAALWMKLKDAGYIYKGLHEGWYSISDETFYPPNQIEEVKGADGLVRTVSKETRKVLQWTAEENYKFRLSAVRQKLVEWLESNCGAIIPKSQYTLILSQLKDPAASSLSDISISRPRSRLQWGIPVPDDPEHVVYVWLDALTNYLTVTAAGLPLPKTILSHAHWLAGNVKMSKSLGNVVDPATLIARYGVDPVRYFLLRDGGIEDDGEYSNATMVKRYRELGITLGNLASRCSGPKVNPAQVVPASGDNAELAKNPVVAAFEGLRGKVEARIDECDFPGALSRIIDALDVANKYWDEEKPWKLATAAKDGDKQAARRLQTALFICYEAARVSALLMSPVMPQKTAALLDMIAVDPKERAWSNAEIGKRWASQSNKSESDCKLAEKVILFPQVV
ncbi:methionyl-tRNA synthetase [Irineochytrium annulatum]|nr:methionyl-tRNA synthetase [Irineochytrium annulatum]